MTLESTGFAIRSTNTGSFVGLHLPERSTGVSGEGATCTTKLVLQEGPRGRGTRHCLFVVIVDLHEFLGALIITLNLVSFFSEFLDAVNCCYLKSWQETGLLSVKNSNCI